MCIEIRALQKIDKKMFLKFLYCMNLNVHLKFEGTRAYAPNGIHFAIAGFLVNYHKVLSPNISIQGNPQFPLRN